MKGDTNSSGTVPFTTNMAHMGRPHPQSAWGKGRREGRGGGGEIEQGKRVENIGFEAGYEGFRGVCVYTGGAYGSEVIVRMQETQLKCRVGESVGEMLAVFIG
jgi:hypothetical protein